jgi:hypothetical protein
VTDDGSNRESISAFLETLPEAEEDRTPDILFLTEVFDEFLGNVIESTGTASINVAAGIARNRLRGVE